MTLHQTIPAPPLACVPGAIPAAERPAHFALIKRLFGEMMLERVAIAGGYAYRFEAQDVEMLARFIANERKCCPFLTFTIELPAADATLWLRLTGPDGAREFLDAELST